MRTTAKKRANDMAEQPMKVLVVSDVHGRVTPLRWLLKNETADALFFLGDGLYDLNQAIAANGAAPDYPIYRVRGADVVLFGHTHYKTLRHGTPFSPTLFNPGSLRDTHSYGVITITDGQCSFEWKQVPEQW